MKTGRLALAAALLTGSGWASAAITCSTVTSPGFSMFYIPAGTTVVQSSFTVTCSRGLGSDPASHTYQVQADNGNNAAGGWNRAFQGGSSIQYDVYQDSACTTKWQGGGGRISDTITWGAATGTMTKQTFFWACAPNGQAGKPAGTYTDSIGMTLRWGTNPNRNGTVAVSVQTPAVCTVTSTPTVMNFNYVAFGPLVNSSSTFNLQCNLGMPYWLTLPVNSGTIAGLAYTLSVNGATQSGAGTPRLETVNGAMAGGQAGICAVGTCTPAAQVHSVTINY